LLAHPILQFPAPLAPPGTVLRLGHLRPGRSVHASGASFIVET